MRTGLMRAWMAAGLAAVMAHLVAAAQTAPSSGGYVVIWPGSKDYHWPSCPLIKAAKGVAVVTRTQASSKGYTPHRDCNPANVPGAAPTYVFIAKDDGKYHRAGCALLPKDAKKVLLNKDAVRGRWPCTACRPPIRAAATRTPQ
jgi:hypothetical protein